MNFFDLDVSYFRSNETFFVGLFHGTLYSLPFSVPALLCIAWTLEFNRRSETLNQGVHSESFGVAQLGSLAPSLHLASKFARIFLRTCHLQGFIFGQLSFLSFCFYAARPLIQSWYSFEPFFALLGGILGIRSATQFYYSRQSTLQLNSNSDFAESLQQSTSESGSKSAFWKIFSQLRLLLACAFPSIPLRFFIFQFFLIFLNPVFPAVSSKMVFSQDALHYFNFLYCLGFALSSFFVLNSFVFLFPRVENLFSEVVALARKSFDGSRVSNVTSLQSGSDFQKKIFTFCILGILIQGNLLQNWRFFTQYPFDFLPRSGQQSLSVQQNVQQSLQLQKIAEVQKIAEEPTGNLPLILSKLLQREFPTFDSSIRHREKNLPVERHLPIERMNARRTLSGRPAFNEEQKSDALKKYNSFFLNSLESFFEEKKIQVRQSIDRGQIHYSPLWSQVILRRLKLSGGEISRQIPLGQTGGQNAQQNVHQGIQSEVFQRMTRLAPITNNIMKGKPKFSYCQELFSVNENLEFSIDQNPYVHDDLKSFHKLSNV